MILDANRHRPALGSTGGPAVDIDVAIVQRLHTVVNETDDLVE